MTRLNLENEVNRADYVRSSRAGTILTAAMVAVSLYAGSCGDEPKSKECTSDQDCSYGKVCQQECSSSQGEQYCSDSRYCLSPPGTGSPPGPIDR